MRKSTFLGLLFFLFCLSITARAAPASTPAAAEPVSNPSTVALSPEQAKHALQVLGDPKSRAQMEDTLRAIAAAGALATPPAASAPAAAPASGASAVLAAITSNGLVSQVSRQTVQGIRAIGTSLRHSAAALLDIRSVRAWWVYEMTSKEGRAQLEQLAWTLAATFVPAWLVSWLCSRLLRKRVRALATGGAEPLRASGTDNGAESGAAASANARADARADSTVRHFNANVPAANIDEHAMRAARSGRDAAHAGRHWSVLQRLPYALLRTFLEAISLAAFIGVAIVAMSLLTDDGTPEADVVETVIEIYVIARAVVLASAFLFADDAPRLRMLPLGDAWAAFGQHWVLRLVVVLGIGVALAETPVPLGLTAEAHLGIAKVVALAGHLMIAMLILQIRRPVADWLRTKAAASRVLRFFGNWLADIWAPLAVFLVMALWFIWALDVRNGYQALLEHVGFSLLILIGARVIAIVTFGILGRMFGNQNGGTASVALQRAQRYYPMLRRLIWLAILVTAASLVLWVWNVHIWHAFTSNFVGRRVASACTTIAIAVLVALLVWESINVSIERRLRRWTDAGDLMRAARLRTLLPMLRSSLLFGIGLIVGLTGLSELGVNIGPLLAGASVLGVALGLGAQKVVQDFLTGTFLLMENAMQVGDWVTLAGLSGTVEYLSIRTVRLRGGDGALHTIPFSSVSTVSNSNRGLGNAAVKVSIAYGQDIDLAVRTLREIGAGLREDPAFKDGIVGDFSFWGVDQVDGSMVTLLGQMQCRDTARWPTQREFNRRIAETFRESGIVIANPLRNVLVPGEAHQPVADSAAQTDGANDGAQARRPEPDKKPSAHP
ncbi:MAG TPA: mechanosensitive ion channel domain-containing protein [Trinickia sp.]|uniref:mechanosensitive ion channel family protein n=1 Tax=Trinickia sp. TaxID=2571163 RepID=UPI002BE8E962|nr:mechanosensitive ion channel domain-containing protein [Trinickia sp.]HVW50041.1 mechanosensitive ion channel domain-containing protein [Trinickia sp.]